MSRGQSPDLSVFGKPAIIVPLFALGLLSLIPTLWKRLQAHEAAGRLDVTNVDSQNEIKNS